MKDYLTARNGQLAAIITAAVANLFVFIGTLTPAWQVAYDADVGRSVESGLWLYCPGASQCWYIFSDNLVNYYERVDVCRFFLIGDCRKKLLRTPYFFGWHYAVLTLNIIAMVLVVGAIISAILSMRMKHMKKLLTILYDVFILAGALFLGISLIVFVVNAEMLESKYLIGVKNTFEKHYGYSFYLAALGQLILLMAVLAGVMLTTLNFFYNPSPSSRMASNLQLQNGFRVSQYYQEQPKVIPQQFTQQYTFPPSYQSTGFNTPMRAATPQSQLPPLNVTHGEYIPPAVSPTGEFQPKTRHFYSY